MPKKVIKKHHIEVDDRKQNYWVLEENVRKGERTLETKKSKRTNKTLHKVKRNRSGYEYDKEIEGFEWTKKELEQKLAARARKGPIEQKSIAIDIIQKMVEVY